MAPGRRRRSSASRVCAGPTRGSLRVLGLDPVTDADRLRGLVGSQLQSAGLPDRLRVGEAVRLFSGRASEELLEQFGLSERRRSAFASLSGGERQRLFLVLALVNRPPLVILDELTQGLDPRRGAACGLPSNNSVRMARR